MYLTLASEVRIAMEVVGDVTHILDYGCFLALKDCLYVVDSRKKLILVSSLCKLNYLLAFDNKHVFIKLNNMFRYSGSLVYKKISIQENRKTTFSRQG